MVVTSSCSPLHADAVVLLRVRGILRGEPAAIVHSLLAAAVDPRPLRHRLVRSRPAYASSCHNHRRRFTRPNQHRFTSLHRSYTDQHRSYTSLFLHMHIICTLLYTLCTLLYVGCTLLYAVCILLHVIL